MFVQFTEASTGDLIFIAEDRIVCFRPSSSNDGLHEVFVTGKDVPLMVQEDPAEVFDAYVYDPGYEPEDAS